MPVRRYFGLAALRWELPFSLRIAAAPIACWEPTEGSAMLRLQPNIGTVQWRRSNKLLSGKEAFGDRFEDEDEWTLPSRSYRMAAVIRGREYFTTELSPGANGGFDEAQPYTVATIFLCLRHKGDFDTEKLKGRAAAALNNVIGIHGMIALDGYTRPVRPELDSYYTTVSLSTLPEDWPQLSPAQVFERLDLLQFSTEIGHGRHHGIGLGSAEDLCHTPFDTDEMAIVERLAKSQVELRPYQSLMLSSLRRLIGRDTPQAVIDAQSAAEVCVGHLLRTAWLEAGRTDAQIEAEFNEIGVGQRIVRLDKLNKQINGSNDRFESSPIHQRWTKGLASLRHRIVHGGLRTVPFADAQRCASTALAVIVELERLWPGYAPPFRWSPELESLPRLRETKGKLFRLFDS